MLRSIVHNAGFPRNVFNSHYFNHVSAIAGEKGFTMGEHQYTSSDPRAVAPMITANPPLEMQRERNHAAFNQYSMVPSMPFYEGEEIPYLGGEEIINEFNFNMGPEIIMSGYGPGKMVLAFILGAVLVYFATKRR